MHLGTTTWLTSHDGSANALLAQAQRAEALGYQSFWLPENHFHRDAIPDPLTVLAALAAGTSTIRLATSSLLITLRHPLQIAEQVAVLDRLCSGRLILGVGRGFSAPVLRAFNVAPADKRAVFERNLEAMVAAWTQTDRGDVQVHPTPFQQPHPPIWVAAFGPKALRQAGRLGLPYLASPLEDLATLERNQALHRDSVDEAGHTAALAVPIMRSICVVTSQTERDEVISRVDPRVLERVASMGGGDLDSWAIVGEAAYVRERLAEYRERLGVTHLIATRLGLAGQRPELAENSLVKLVEILN